MAMEIVFAEDPNAEHSSLVEGIVYVAGKCYQDLYAAKKEHAVQTTTEQFFQSSPQDESTPNRSLSPQPGAEVLLVHPAPEVSIPKEPTAQDSHMVSGTLQRKIIVHEVVSPAPSTNSSMPLFAVVSDLRSSRYSGGRDSDNPPLFFWNASSSVHVRFRWPQGGIICLSASERTAVIITLPTHP